MSEAGTVTIDDGGQSIATAATHPTTVPVQRQIKAWYRGICILQTCHSDFAYKYQWMDRMTNAVSVSLTAITSSVIFTSISPASLNNSGTSNEHVLAMMAGIFAAINAVVQSLHRALGLAESAERHFMAHKQFTSMRFRLERLTCGNFGECGTIMVDEIKLDEWAADYGKVLESAPIIPQDKFDAVRQSEMERENRYFRQNSNTNTNGEEVQRGIGSWTLNPIVNERQKATLYNT